MTGAGLTAQFIFDPLEFTMPKASRRERRRMAEKGRSAPQRVPSTGPAHGASMEPRERVVASQPAPAVKAAAAPVVAVGPREYAYVKADLIRIAVLASSLIAGMIALRFILPQ